LHEPDVSVLWMNQPGGSLNYDIVIVGGGVIGSSIAYHLAAAGQRSVLVIERDLTYARASSALSASSIRQQFVTPACIRMSQFSFDFLRNLSEHLSVAGERVELPLVERGYLYLADAARARSLAGAIAVQQAHEVPVLSLERELLAQRFPWLHCADIELAALGTAGEGWFDGYTLLQAFRRKARQLGVEYLQEEAAGLLQQGSRVSGVRLSNGASIGAAVVVNAAGPHSAGLAASAGFFLPVRPERRCIFAFSCPENLDFIPLVIDPSGLWVRPEGRLFIAGGPSTPIEGPDPLTLNVDYSQFDDFIWPALAERIPAFESIKMTSAWAGHYEMNLFDHNALIGWTPGVSGLVLATGFSGHGMQHSPAAGRGVAELIIQGRYLTLDLSELSPERLVRNEPIVEANII
jgi:FAD-dependent oxidoreductase domain-containing protein 1